MNKIAKIILTLFGLFVGLVIIEIYAESQGYLTPWSKISAKNCIKTWGGLSDFPDSTEVIELTTSGSMFTRTFHMTFKASTEDLKSWIKSSKRLKNNQPTLENGLHVYEIMPGEEKAIGGTVKINWKENLVFIKMMWS